jgi:hypothetical protein
MATRPDTIVATPGDPGFRHDPLGGTGEAAHRQMRYRLERDLDYRIDRHRRDGKDPLDLFDPSKPDYAGKPEALLPYQLAALRQALEERARQVHSAAKASADTSRRRATPGELDGARHALFHGADHRVVIHRFNAHGVDFSDL